MAQKNKKLKPASDKASASDKSSAGQAGEARELEKLKKKCEEYLNGWKRERADFLNYKKEEMERIGQLVKYANQKLILEILLILDNFYRAEKHVSDSEEVAGFIQIKKQLEDFLAKQGIKPIEVVDKKFDPNTMEAVGGDGETVTDEIQRGYTMHGKVIRPAKVKIAK